jgi:hypothetical protein
MLQSIGESWKEAFHEAVLWTEATQGSYIDLEFPRISGDSALIVLRFAVAEAKKWTPESDVSASLPGV